MKKIFLTVFSVLMSLVLINSSKTMNVSADYDTGHNEYKSIEFDDGNSYLLCDMSSEAKEKSMKKVGWTFFGWKQYYNYVNVIGRYVGKTIFSRSNMTLEDICFSYQAQTKETNETSVTSEGSITGEFKANNKGKTVSGGLEAKIRKQIGVVNSVQIQEKTSFKVTIKPGYRVSLIAKGDLRLNNGSAKYYFLGIPFKKGHWEIIDVLSEYYELVEEYIK